MVAYGCDKFVDAQSVASCVMQGAIGYSIGKNASLGATLLSGTRVRSLSSANVYHPLAFEIAVSLADGVRIDSKLNCQIAHRGERLIGSQCAENERASDLVDYLNVDRPRVLWIQRDEHNRCVMVYQLPNTLYLIRRAVKRGSF